MERLQERRAAAAPVTVDTQAIPLTDDGERMSSESCSGAVRRRIWEPKERAR
jgi:hypothetical protein